MDEAEPLKQIRFSEGQSLSALAWQAEPQEHRLS